jgi:RimJ/RimL family protein N-acetyltransferase
VDAPAGTYGLIPATLRTARLLLRPWRAGDAEALGPVLEANREHIGPWIPARVAEPAPIPELARRLSGFAEDFAAAREWRYGLFTPDECELLGEIGLYPRRSSGRVPYAEADRAELGYWLRADATGQGLVTEAARAVLAVAATLPRLSRVEIRCDARNLPSAAVPRRLGFVLERIVQDTGVRPAEASVHLQVWTSSLAPAILAKE